MLRDKSWTIDAVVDFRTKLGKYWSGCRDEEVFSAYFDALQKFPEPVVATIVTRTFQEQERNFRPTIAQLVEAVKKSLPPSATTHTAPEPPDDSGPKRAPSENYRHLSADTRAKIRRRWPEMAKRLDARVEAQEEKDARERPERGREGVEEQNATDLPF